MRYQLLGLVYCFIFSSNALAFANANKLVGTKLEFERFDITSPLKVSLPVIAANIVTESPADELVLVGEDEFSQTWLAVYVFDINASKFVVLDKIKLTDDLFAYDVSENKEGLYFLSKNTVVSLKYNTEIKNNDIKKSGLYFEEKQAVNSIFLLNKASYITKKNFIRDINKDGADDIVLPDFEQTNLWLSSDDKSGSNFQKIAIDSRSELDRGGVVFKPVELFYEDFNLDDLQDVAWITQGKINYVSQNKDGSFSTQYNTIDLADSIYGLNWWDLRESDGQSPDQSDLTHRAVEQIKDINGDGFTDVIVKYTQSSGVLDRANDYEFYFGYLNEQAQLAYSKKPSTVIRAEGTLTGLKILDVNEDKKFEVLLSSFELSVSNIIGALLSGGIDQNVLIFALNNDDKYEEDALISKEVELNFSLSSGQSGQPVVRLGDVNGDKLQDLLLSSGEEKLRIYLGNSSSGLFNRKASKHKVLLPKNGGLLEAHDLNNDGKEDIIMSYGRLDEESMANKVTILMVK